MQAKALTAMVLVATLVMVSPARAQRIQFPTNAGGYQGSGPVMVPLVPNQGAIAAPTGSGLGSFDPYTTRQVTTPNFPSAPVVGQYGAPGIYGQPSLPAAPYGQYGTPNPTINPNYGTPVTGYPGYNGAAPSLPGTGQSGILGTYPNTNPSIYGPSAYPSGSPSALFPGAYPQAGSNYGYGQNTGGWFGNWFGNGSSWNGTAYGQPGVLPQPGNLVLPQGGSWGNWNPQGSIFNGSPTYPQFLRLFQGPRFRHAWIYGSKDNDALQINDSDIALAFAIPNFLFSNQPVYLLPSFSVHQWEGPGNVAADLPAIAYSAFLDAGWQSDPSLIAGVEAALRVGMFSDFETATSDSLRIMGRALGRIRLTPAASVKLGAVYLDRNKIKLLPAGGLLWQPNPETRFDLFFPEPKLAHYLATVGTVDTWWYVGGYYGGGAWTVKRQSGEKQSIDINDLRLVLGLEWGRNEQMRDGRRFGFLEVGYVFQRELLFKQAPADNLDLQDSVMVRAGIGY